MAMFTFTLFFPMTRRVAFGTSDERRSGSLLREYGLATLSGALYGATNTIVGHPFDTVKTKMQAQASFGSQSMSTTMRQIWAAEGAAGFYRGCLPPMWGSAVYRSAQFSVYSTLHAAAETSDYSRFLLSPCLGDMEWRVPLAGFMGATSRTVLESPIEYAKVKGQTGQRWAPREIYQGSGLQWLRTGPMMTLYFCLFDACTRNGLTTTGAGQFFCSGGSALVGFWVVWPFETLKNKAQAGDATSIAAQVRRRGGILGLYRGIVPGSLSVFLRNGAAMIVMQRANAAITRLGLRDA